MCDCKDQNNVIKLDQQSVPFTCFKFSVFLASMNGPFQFIRTHLELFEDFTVAWIGLLLKKTQRQKWAHRVPFKAAAGTKWSGDGREMLIY